MFICQSTSPYTPIYVFALMMCAYPPITLPPANQKPCMKSALIWEITQCVFVISCRTLRQGPIAFRDKSIRDYIHTLCNFTKEHTSHLLRGGILKSCKRCVSAQYVPRTHLATPVASIVLFPPDLVGLVPLLLWDFSVSASEASGGSKIVCSEKSLVCVCFFFFQ